MSNQGDGQEPPQQPDDSGENTAGQQPDNTGGHPLPGQSGRQRLPGHTGGQPQNTGGQPPQGPPWGPQPGQPPQGPPPQGQPGPPPSTGGQPQQGDTGGQWTGGQQPWTGGQPPLTGGQPPWSSGGQQAQPPSWSTGETGPNVGPTMNNPQSSYYDRFSAASGEGVVVPDGGGGGGRGKILMGVAAALVVVIAAVAVFALTRGDDDSPTEASTPSTSSLPPVTATTWVNPTKAAGSRALKSGWQAQHADDGRGVFDVPKNKDWKLGTSTTYFGYADNKGKPLVVTKAPAQYHVGFCKAKDTDDTGWLGLVNVGKRDPSDAGPDVAQKFADAIALKKDDSHVKQGKMSPAKQIKVNQGTIPALEYTITTPTGQPDACDKGKKYEVRTVTFQAAGKSYQLVCIRMLDAPDGKGLSNELLDEIITTFRPGN